MGIHVGSDSKESAFIALDLGLSPVSGRPPEEENGTSLQYSCLENPMDRRAEWATVHGVTKSQTQQSDFHFSLSIAILVFLICILLLINIHLNLSL